MKKIIKLTESDLEQIVKKVLKEQSVIGAPNFGIPNYGNSFLPKGVKEVQSVLTFKGYYVGKNGADGVMGPDTKRAIIKFQKDNGIKQTGNVGPVTAKALGVQPLTKAPVQNSPNNKSKKIDPNIAKQQMGSLSTRTYEQLESMKSKEQLKNKPFIVVNKSAAVASLFGPNYTFITNSSITTGRLKDTGVDNKVDKSQKNWFEMSLKEAKTNPTSADGIKINDWIKKNKSKPGLVSSDGTVSWVTYLALAAVKKVDVFPFSYTVRTKLGLDITPSGVYGISAGEEEKGYAGAGNQNTFPLIDPDSVGEITPAIHGYAGKERGDAIKKASSQGVDADKSTLTRVGSGCINVTPEFLTKMRETNPSYVIILPDTGGVVDIKVTTFQKFKVGLTQLGAKCVKSLSSLFS
jgi:peptidoglycan hydrolase-like protein with peptidoglycan-binding domain